MKKTKIFVLEMCSGLFECVWIGAAIISIYWLYGAMADDAPWVNLLWSVGAGFIAKPIAVALDSARRRLDYISQLVERGYDQVASEVAWRSADDGGTNLLRNLRQADVGDEIFRLDSAIGMANSRHSVD
jgi:hypothetical protein